MTDHLGSTILAVKSNGTVRNRYLYRPYGDPVAEEGPEIHHQFTGGEELQDADLYALGARYYDAEVGRFLQPDPIVGDYGDPQAFNAYSYALNSSTNLIDPTGLSPICVDYNECYESGGGSSGWGVTWTFGGGDDDEDWVYVSWQDLAAMPNPLRGSTAPETRRRRTPKPIGEVQEGVGPAASAVRSADFGTQLAIGLGALDPSDPELNRARMYETAGTLLGAGAVAGVAGGVLGGPAATRAAAEGGRRALSLGRTAAAAGRTAAERAAARGTQFVADPKAGFAKGFGVGLNKGFFAGDAAVELPAVNPGFDRGVAAGEFIGGNILAPISRYLTGFPP